MIDRELRIKLAQTLAHQILGPQHPVHGAQSGALNHVFHGLALMNRLEEVVTKSFRTSPELAPEPAVSMQADPVKQSLATQMMSRQAQIQKRINESNRRMTQALLDLARRHMKSKHPAVARSEFSRPELPQYGAKDAQVKPGSYFRRSTESVAIFQARDKT